MLKTDTDFYKDIIIQACPDASNIRYPDIRGGVCPVFVVDTKSGTQVFKFNNREVAVRNYELSSRLQENGIVVPKTSVCICNDKCFEKYDYCPDKTLYEHISGHSLNKTQIENTYKQALSQLAATTVIKPVLFVSNPMLNYPEVFTKTMKQKLNPWLAEFYGYFVCMFSQPGSTKLVHNDMNPKNLLVSADGSLTRILDMDAVALANESFAVMMTLRYYPLNNHREMIEFYQDITGHKLNEQAIMFGIKIIKAMRAQRQKFDSLFVKSNQR